MKNKNYLVILVLISLFAGCAFKGRLTIPFDNYQGNKLKFNGFYCNINNKNNSQVIYYFFKNGLVSGESTSNYKKAFKYTEEHYNNQYELPYFWGVYSTKNDSNLLIEKWMSNFNYSTYKFTGEILNDTTIILNHPSISIGRDTFYYFKTDIKPDSSKITFEIK